MRLSQEDMKLFDLPVLRGNLLLQQIDQLVPIVRLSGHVLDAVQDNVPMAILFDGLQRAPGNTFPHPVGTDVQMSCCLDNVQDAVSFVLDRVQDTGGRTQQ